MCLLGESQLCPLNTGAYNLTILMETFLADYLKARCNYMQLFNMFWAQKEHSVAIPCTWGLLLITL